MYLPSHFSETRTEVLHNTLCQNPLGTLVAVVSGAATADEIPFVLAPERGTLGTLCGHVARANPLAHLPSGQHQALVIFVLVLVTLFGVLSYGKLAQSEDPPFTFKVMVVRTVWPGATARQVQEQVTDRIARKLQETPAVPAAGS